jgi:hypothetical protein
MEGSEMRSGVIEAPRVFVEPDEYEEHFVLPRRVRLPRLPGQIVKTAYGVIALATFIFALELLKGGAAGALSLLDRLAADGPVNLFGFGWLGAYVLLSGSPVAATALGLFTGTNEAISSTEAFAMINGSRFGASFIVLLVGFVYYLRHRRNPDGLYIGVVALLTTFTIYTPSFAIGLLALDQGWFDSVRAGAPPGLVSVTDATVGGLADRVDELLPSLLMFVLGAGVLVGSFQLFDRVLPNLEPPSPRLERVLGFFHRPLPMFLMGGLVTLATLSVSISLTLLVPLSMKGVVRRHGIIPYVMGANITTFIDTLFAAVLLDKPMAVTIVITQMTVTAAVSAVVLLALYGPYQRAILGLAHRVTSTRRGFALFLGAIVAVPVVLLAV